MPVMSRPLADYNPLTIPGVAVLTLGWLGVGLFTAATWWLAAGWDGQPRNFAALVQSPVVAGLCWVPITLVAFAAVRRWPLGPRVSSRRLAFYSLAALSTTFVLNGAWALTMMATGAIPIEYVGGQIVANGLRWLHLNTAVCAVLIAAAHWLRPRSQDDTEAQETSYRSTLVSGTNGSRRLLDVDAIDWIAAAGDYSTVHVDGGEHLVGERLKELEATLDPAEFVRIHRSTIVRIDRIREIRSLGRGDYEVRLESNVRLRVARRRRQPLQNLLARRAGA